MARTFLVERNKDEVALFNSNTHDRLTAVERAAQTDAYKDNHTPVKLKFTFDLMEFISRIRTERLKLDVISRLQFSIDAHITISLSRMLSSLYGFSQSDESTKEFTFDTYEKFLRHIEGIDASEQALYEAGCDVKPAVDALHNLIALRNEFHYASAMMLVDPTKYEMPDIYDMVANPRMRKSNAQNDQEMANIADDEVKRLQRKTKFTTEHAAKLTIELTNQLKMDDQFERANQLKMEIGKAKSLVMLLNCVHAGATSIDGYVDEQDDAFFTTDVVMKEKLIKCVVRAITDTRMRAVKDNRISAMEKAGMRVEAIELLNELDDTLEHDIFVAANES